MASVDRYNSWIFSKIEKHLGSRILEVGCGIGNMTPFFLGRGHLVSIDLLADSVESVRCLYSGQPGFEALRADICDGEIVDGLRDRLFDTAVCLNVLEHIEDDAHALRNMASVLQPGGKLILFVPAGSYLYGELDAALLHHRRYGRGSLQSAVQGAGLTVRELYYMNVAGIPGWFLASRVLKRHAPPRGLLGLFNLLAPLFIWAEERLTPQFGLSLVCIAECTSGGEQA